MARFLGLVLVVAFMTSTVSSADAQEASPPVGVWKGKFADGSGGIDLVLTPSGAVSIQVTGGNLITGNWTWQPTATGGIVTIHHYLGGRPNRLYYSVTYINRNTVTFSDPWFRITMQRVG